VALGKCECRAALRMIREAIEMHTPPGSVAVNVDRHPGTWEPRLWAEPGLVCAEFWPGTGAAPLKGKGCILGA
jgi:hypothetical protein